MIILLHLRKHNAESAEPRGTGITEKRLQAQSAFDMIGMIETPEKLNP
jgi:hypothetical protein